MKFKERTGRCQLFMNIWLINVISKRLVKNTTEQQNTGILCVAIVCYTTRNLIQVIVGKYKWHTKRFQGSVHQAFEIMLVQLYKKMGKLRCFYKLKSN